MNDALTATYEIDRNGWPLASATGATLVSTLIGLGLAGTAAFDMPLDEVVEQVNEVNGGEVTVRRFLM